MNFLVPHGVQINPILVVVVAVTSAALEDVVTLAGDVGAAAKYRPPPANSTKRKPGNLCHKQTPRRHTPPGQGTCPTPAETTPSRPLVSKSTTRDDGGCPGAGGFGRRGDGGVRPRCGGQIRLMVRQYQPAHAQQPTPHPGTRPTHATGPGHTPNTGRITSPTPNGAQMNVRVFVVVAVASAALSDVVTGIGDPAAAGKSARRRQAPTW